VEKVEKSSLTKTRQIAIRRNIAAQYHLRPAADLARCLFDKLAGPPADFLNAAPISLAKDRTSPKGSFSTSGNGRWLFPETDRIGSLVGRGDRIWSILLGSTSRWRRRMCA